VEGLLAATGGTTVATKAPHPGVRSLALTGDIEKAQLTYMSIVQFIKTHEANNGVLRRVLPPQGQSASRAALLAPMAQSVLDDQTSAISILGCRPYVQSMLERWVANRPMAVRLSGTKPGAFLARLEPPPSEVWEFRITEPVNHVRVFCRFAMPNLVIVTNLSTRKILGLKGSAAWRSAMELSVAEWRKLFPGVDPHQGASIYDYVTENCRQVR